MYRIESLLSGRLFLAPQVVGNRIFFISNLAGRLSLYAMDYGGSVPEPLLPSHIALQNPHLLGGTPFKVFPKLKKILIALDQDGNEVYQPMVIPMDGGFPEPAFGDKFTNYRCHFGQTDLANNIFYITAESLAEPVNETYRANLETGELHFMGSSPWGNYPAGVTEDHREAIMLDGYSVGDNVLYYWSQEKGERELLYGTPTEMRVDGQEIPLNAIFSPHFTEQAGLLFGTALFDDKYSLGYFKLADAEKVVPVPVLRTVHTGIGEFEDLTHLAENRYLLRYNIDGASWVYEAEFDENELVMTATKVLCGQGELANGVLESINFEKESGRYAISFSTAVSPTQIYTLEPTGEVVQHTRERILGIPSELLSSGEDASFTSYDETRVSARLYLPAQSLGFSGKRPVVYYIHGGPQGQERPDFAWFSMPIIQYLTLNGFAVFVPNVRGSTGYGLNYTKQVDRDWGGYDRLDHVYAMKEVLPRDERLDVSRAGVVGRSYGGYMTLTLAARHPELWKAAVDMFGPYDLVTFLDRIPETWKPYFTLVLGNPENPADREFLAERSPATYIDQVTAPMLVIQGKNDPRVIEQESRDVVEYLRGKGKQVEYLMFENEGHDVLKHENRVTCYNAINDFFRAQLRP